MTRKILFAVLFLISLTIQGQEKFIDSIYKVASPLTLTYAVKNGDSLKLDIYQPVGDTLQDRPVIIFMHGGGFAGGSRSSEGEVKFARAAAQRGYLAVQISYRLTRKGKSFGCDFDAEGKRETFKKAAEDFMDAVVFMVENKARFNINPEKIIAGGSSAGAEAFLNALYNEHLIFENSEKYNEVDFAGVFSLAGAILDARYITGENAIPGIFFHGTEDNLVPFGTGPHHWCEPNRPGYIMLDGSRTIANKLKELNAPYALFSFEGGKHEHSGMPVAFFPEVFRFFKLVFLEGENLQWEVNN